LPPLAIDLGFDPGGAWPLGLLFLGAALFAAVGALSHEHERAFSASLIYLGLGIAAAAVIGLLDIGWLDPVGDHEPVERLCELAIVVAVFSAGLKLDRALRWGNWGSTARLLAIAMPLTIGAVALFGATAMGLSAAAAVLLGAALAPTDPVLAGDIGVGPPGEEEEYEPNFALTSEAGLNDGLAAPFILLGLLIAEDGSPLEWLAADVLYGVLVAVAVGAGIGVAAAWSVKRLRDRELLMPRLDGWHALATALVTYGIVESADALGFVAVFAAGLAFRRYERDHEINERVHIGSETAEKFLELAVILLLGSVLTLDGLGVPGVSGWLLAVVLLVVIRPLSCALALAGSKMERPGERAFVSWFGVRGVASFYYGAVIVASGALAPDEAAVVMWTAIACVLVSIAAHGLTAGPALRRLLARERAMQRRARSPASARAR
jgi:NhaP-type Na+/H+ or K+/H+ antiporter